MAAMADMLSATSPRDIFLANVGVSLRDSSRTNDPASIECILVVQARIGVYGW